MDSMILSLLVFIIILQIIIGKRMLSRLNKLQIDHTNSSRENKQEDYREEWKDEVKRTVELQCMTVRNAVQKQNIDLHVKEIQYSPRQLSIPHKKLQQVYAPKQLSYIEDFWNSYENYLYSFWLNKRGDIRTVFSGDRTDPTSEAGRIIMESQKLTYGMNGLLTEIMAQ